MNLLYRESRPVLPRNLVCLIVIVLVVIFAFIVFSQHVQDTEMSSWTILIIAVIFTVIIILLMVLRMDVDVNGECVRIIYMFKRMGFGR